MEHTFFAHASAWVVFGVNVLGLGILFYRAGKAMGVLGSSVESLAGSVKELKTEVGGLRDELVEQGKLVARIEGERRLA